MPNKSLVRVGDKNNNEKFKKKAVIIISMQHNWIKNEIFGDLIAKMPHSFISFNPEN